MGGFIGFIQLLLSRVSVFDGIMTAVAVIVMLLFLFTKEYRKGERV